MGSIRIAFLFSLVLTSCAPTIKNDDLYSQFITYNQVVNQQNVKMLAPNYLTKHLLDNLNFDHPMITGEFIVFSRYIDEETAHYEIINDDTGCLSVSGLNTENEPVNLSIEYQYLDKWRIDYVHVSYLQSALELKNQITCPLNRN